MIGPSETRWVRPRVVERDTGAVVLLTDAIEERLARAQPSQLGLNGSPGAGRRTALAFLRQHFADELAFAIVEGDRPSVVVAHVMIVSHAMLTEGLILTGDLMLTEELSLAPWTRDEWIEFLLLRHAEACTHVMARLDEEPAVHAVLATPQIAVLVLDFLATTGGSSVRRALDHVLTRLAPAPLSVEECADLALEFCHQRRTASRDVQLEVLRGTPLAPFQPLVDELVLLGLRRALEEDRLERLPKAVPRGTLELDPAAWSRAAACLERCLYGEPSNLQASAATLLHRLGRLAACWSRSAPPRGMQLARAELQGLEVDGLALPEALLSEARLGNARLQRASLVRANLERAHLAGAVLDRADLDGVRAEGADFRAVSLRSALLRGARLAGACFAEAELDLADLSGADLSGCDLRGASLRSARLDKATLAGLDLRETALQRARFFDTNLQGANLEGCRIELANFTGADLSHALLSGTHLRGASLVQANLRGAGLAEVDWEGADLRGADLSHASFHFGSTRAGLLPGAPPSFGTRTGFYTDDLIEAGQRAPEELRRANLRGVELRGAHILRTDFYLVDLRDARFTREQERHLRATGALLGDTRARDE